MAGCHAGGLPLWHLADLRLPDGVGDKRIIRTVSRRIGLADAAALPKRAIQFGSRSAKCFKCNSDGGAHVDAATLSDQTAARPPSKKKRPTRAARRAVRDRGSQYPGRKAKLADGAGAAGAGPIERVPWTGSGEAVSAEAFFFLYQIPNRPVVLSPPLPPSWGRLSGLTKPGDDGGAAVPDVGALVTLAGAQTVVPVDVGPADGGVASSAAGTESRRELKTLGEYAEWWESRAPPAGAKEEEEEEEVWYLKDWHLARHLGQQGLYAPLPHFAEEFDWLNGWWDHLNTERRRRGGGGGGGGRATAPSREPEPEPDGVSSAAADKGRVDDYRFVYLGPRGSWTPLHHDVLASCSWSTNLCGVKRWLLFPPEATRLLYNRHGLTLATDAREVSAQRMPICRV
jgi:hypothetical protein